MIGAQRKREITTRSELVEELRTATLDKIKVFDNATSAADAEHYIRQNRQLTHSIIVVSHKA